MRRYVIIGTGAAGISAAETICQKDTCCRVILVGEEAAPFYSRPALAFYLTGELPESQLYPFGKRDFSHPHIKRIHGRATRIFPKEHKVEIRGKGFQLLPYDRLLIASGATAIPLAIPGAKLRGVVKLDSLADARQILGWASRTRSAVVVGGGITALELVEGLRARRIQTHYFLRGDRYWGDILDAYESQIVEERLKKEGVQLHYRTEVVEILGRRGRVCGVRTMNGHEIGCEMVAVAIGVRPRLEIARASGLETRRGILVDDRLRTNATDIFAAGDVAEVLEPLSGISTLNSLWGAARQQGIAAGLNMLGHDVAYRKDTPFNVTRLAGLTTMIVGKVSQSASDDLVGIARGESETWRQLPDAIMAQSNFDVNRLRLLIGTHKLIGAVVIGDQTLSRPIQHMVCQGLDITPIREKLLRPGALLGDVIANYWIQRESCRVA